ncbi:lytic polysaccharide monooxygenase [Melanomma pulvis-pyrius CBS 109.77]|uniref:AA9 family lytic polysaccharide monooxygenase n=1 Tax=Melanomma pulvis-pyrius CBS 109.77 TaxID=1314802 RepID=A0A6A6XLN8_9PLEO|nr:lytic polysaccharide monooxygenase [Melanomma pulvis-pyrius CBS 109.77]
MKFQRFVFTSCLFATTLAHGGIFTYEIGDKKYDGYDRFPFRFFLDVIQRRWWYEPIRDATSTNTTCSYDGGAEYADNALNASLHAPIEAGQTVTTWWDTLDRFIHGEGPLLAYMAKCPGDSCVGWKPTGDVWFKVNQKSFVDGLTAENLWQQYRSIYGRRGDTESWKNGAQEGFPTVIPRNLLPGKYLLRSEAIYVYPDIPDLNSPGFFQIYANCAQLDVKGKGTKLPEKEYLVSFPGAYKNDDKGLKVYEDYPAPYEFPGPKVWTGE